MTRLIICLLFLVPTSPLLGQTHSGSTYERILADLKAANEEAKTNNLKTVKIFSNKNEHETNGKLIISKSYNELGSIVNKIHHRFIRYKDTESTTYHYDSLNRIIKVISLTTFSKGFITYTGFFYDTDSRVDFIIHDSNKPAELKFDTIRYSYFEDGRIKSRIDKLFNNEKRFHIDPDTSYFFYYGLDTFYYHYDKLGYRVINLNKVDTLDYVIRDRNGCIIGHRDTSIYKTTYIRDSLCNELQYKSEVKKDGKWFLDYFADFKYADKKIIEEAYYYYDRRYYQRTGKLKLANHNKYEYNDKGLVTKKIHLNNKGKIIEVEKYVYETY